MKIKSLQSFKASIGGWRAILVRRGDTVVAGLLAAATLALLTATLNDYGMAWDEGFTVEREERLLEWFARVAGDSASYSRSWSPILSKLDRRSDYLRRAGPESGSPWSRESLRFYWQFAREEPNGHPPFYALVGLAGWAVSLRRVGTAHLTFVQDSFPDSHLDRPSQRAPGAQWREGNRSAR